MWGDTHIPSEELAPRRRAQIILLVLSIISWAIWGSSMAQIILFVMRFKMAMLVLESWVAVQLVLCMLATFIKAVYNTPILLGATSTFTISATTIQVFILGDDLLFWTTMMLVVVQLVFWVAFTTGEKSVVAKYLHPFGRPLMAKSLPDDNDNISIRSTTEG